MNEPDRRKYARVGIENLVWYSLLDENDQTISQGMGKALSICRAGLMLETVHPISPECILLNTIDMNNNVIEMKGKIVYCRKTDFGVYQSGISFLAPEAEMDEFASKMVRLHHYTKDGSPAVTDAA
jgi:hypothetical protein